MAVINSIFAAHRAGLAHLLGYPTQRTTPRAKVAARPGKVQPRTRADHLLAAAASFAHLAPSEPRDVPQPLPEPSRPTPVPADKARFGWSSPPPAGSVAERILLAGEHRQAKPGETRMTAAGIARPLKPGSAALAIINAGRKAHDQDPL